MVTSLGRLPGAAGLLLLILHTGQVAAAPVTLVVFSSDGVAAGLQTLIHGFEKKTGNLLSVAFDTTQVLSARIEAGERFDVAILAGPAAQRLAGDGLLTQMHDLATSGIGVAVPVGQPKPDITDVPALEHALLAARAPAFTVTGASGIYVEELLNQWGIANQVNVKAKRVSSTDLPGLVRRGETDLIVQQISELRLIPGTEYIGPLPQAVQRETAFSFAIGSRSSHGSIAQELLHYLSSPVARRAFTSVGMQVP